MGKVKWLDEENAIALWKFTEGDTMEEIMADFRRLTDLITSVDRRTYTIADLLDFKTIPAHSMSYYPEMAKLAPKGDKRSQIIAIVTQRTLITMTTEIFSRVYPDFKGRFAHFPTVEEALDFIHARIRETTT
jgi:hypothetical protein